MAAAKIAEVRHNKKVNIVQIKMNKGPNHTLRDAQVKRFLELREEYLNDGGGANFADMYAATTFLNRSK